jgi:hypothetical protein
LAAPRKNRLSLASSRKPPALSPLSRPHFSPPKTSSDGFFSRHLVLRFLKRTVRPFLGVYAISRASINRSQRATITRGKHLSPTLSAPTLSRCLFFFFFFFFFFLHTLREKNSKKYLKNPLDFNGYFSLNQRQQRRRFVSPSLSLSALTTLLPPTTTTRHYHHHLPTFETVAVK